MIFFETQLLLVRHFEPCDIEPLFALYRDPNVRRFFPEGKLTYEETREEVEWYLHGYPQHPELGSFHLYANNRPQRDEL